MLHRPIFHDYSNHEDYTGPTIPTPTLKDCLIPTEERLYTDEQILNATYALRQAEDDQWSETRKILASLQIHPQAALLTVRSFGKDFLSDIPGLSHIADNVLGVDWPTINDKADFLTNLNILNTPLSGEPTGDETQTIAERLAILSALMICREKNDPEAYQNDINRYKNAVDALLARTEDAPRPNGNMLMTMELLELKIALETITMDEPSKADCQLTFEELKQTLNE